jgi:NTE family protein
MQSDEDEAQRRKADLVIALDEPSRNSSDYSAIDSLIDLGYRKTLEQMASIKHLTQSAPAVAAAPEQVYPIHSITLYNGKEKIERVILSNGATQDLSRQMLVQLATVGAYTGNHDGSNNHGDHAGAINAAAIQNWVDAVYGSGQFAGVCAEWGADSLVLRVQENSSLQQVDFAGNSVYADSTLLACVRSPIGEAITHRQSAGDLVAIIERYRSDGYALAEIRDVRFDSLAGRLQISIDEGRIGAVEIEGAKRTKKIVVLREFPQKPGDIFNFNLSSRGIRNIHSTGLFDQVTLNIKRGDGGALVKIKVQEKPFTVLRLGGRYDTERDARGFVEIGDENVFGAGGKIFFYQEFGSRDEATRLSLRDDRLLKTYLSFSSNLYHQVRQNFVYQNLQSEPAGEYEEERLGFNLALGQHIKRFGAVSGELRVEEVNLKSLSGGGYPAENLTLNAFIIRSNIDTRDRVPFPRRGRFFHAFYESVYADLGARDSFFRFFLKMETFHSRGPHTVRPKISLGAADQTTPFSEQFRLGGPDDIYGLRDQELIGRHFAIGSFEYRYLLLRKPLPKLHFSFRYDLNGVWIDKRDADYRKFHHAFGVSLAAETPLGPLSVAYGRYANSSQQIYVSAGFSF